MSRIRALAAARIFRLRGRVGIGRRALAFTIVFGVILFGPATATARNSGDPGVTRTLSSTSGGTIGFGVPTTFTVYPGGPDGVDDVSSNGRYACLAEDQSVCWLLGGDLRLVRTHDRVVPIGL
jgi:hypothetical protein